jgi:hypothetical protein
LIRYLTFISVHVICCFGNYCLSFFIWPLYCLSFDLRLLITWLPLSYLQTALITWMHSLCLQNNDIGFVSGHMNVSVSKLVSLILYIPLLMAMSVWFFWRQTKRYFFVAITKHHMITMICLRICEFPFLLVDYNSLFQIFVNCISFWRIASYFVIFHWFWSIVNW